MRNGDQEDCGMHISEWRFGNVTTRARECTILNIPPCNLKTARRLRTNAVWDRIKRRWRLDCAADVDRAKEKSAHDEFPHVLEHEVLQDLFEKRRLIDKVNVLGAWTLAIESVDNLLAKDCSSE